MLLLGRFFFVVKQIFFVVGPIIYQKSQKKGEPDIENFFANYSEFVINDRKVTAELISTKSALQILEKGRVVVVEALVI